MKQLTINVSPRERIGSGPSGRVRKEGSVPAVVYGKSDKPQNLKIDASELRVALKELGNTTPIIQLKEGSGTARTSVIREVQRHPITDKYLHVDFHEVAEGEKVALEVPVRAIGEAWGVKNEGGTLEYTVHAVNVLSTTADAPEFIEVDVSALKVGDLIHVGAMKAFENVVYLDDEDLTVFSCVK